MKSLRLIIEDFMNIKHADIDCTVFDSCLIVGREKNNEFKSNGTGKSTIFSAIRYVVFGDVPTSTLDKAVRDGAEKCRVEYHFELLSNTYKIVRSRTVKSKTSDLELYQLSNGNWVSISGRSPSATDRKLKDIIKITSNAFRYSVFFAQADLSGISEPEKGGRLKVLEEPLDISQYAKLKKIADKKLIPIKEEIDKIESFIAAIGDPESEIAQANSDLEFCKNALLEKTSQIDGLKTSIKDKQNAINNLKTTLESENDSSIHENISKLETASKQLENKIQKIDSDITNYNEKIEKNNNNIKELKSELENYEITYNKLSQEKLRSKDIVAAELEKVRNDELHGTKILGQYELDYRNNNKNIPDDDKCYTCDQRITDSYRDEFEKHKQDLLNKLSKNIENTKTNLEKCKKVKTKLQKELDKIIDVSAKLISLDGKITSTKEKTQIAQTANDEIKPKLLELNNEKINLNKEYQDTLKHLKEYREAAQKSSKAEINSQIFELQNELNIYENNLQTTQDEISKLNEKQGGANQKLISAKEGIEKLKSKKEELVSLKFKFKINKLVSSAFGNDIPRYIIHNIIDDLQNETNEVLSEIRPELEVQFTPDLDIYYRYNGSEREYDQLSIGQKVYIAFGLKLGLSKVIKHRIGIDIGFLLIDEVDAALDKAGVDALVDVLRKCQDKFQVFLITHNDSLKDKFGHAIVVENDGDNGAVATLTTSW